MGSKIFVFNKQALYTNASSTASTFTVSQNFTIVPAVTFDNALAANYLVSSLGAQPNGTGALAILSITGAVGAEVLHGSNSSGPIVSVPDPWSQSSGQGNIAPQLGDTRLIDAGDARLLSLAYRNGSLWFGQTVFLPAGAPTRSAVQWFQAAVDGTVQQFGRIDDQTGNFFYAYPSIAVNANNDVLLGYSSFSSSQFGSADYAFHGSLDAPGTLRSDAIFKPGQASYFEIDKSSRNRWGDYSSTVVDPVNDLDMWTLQEYAAFPVNNSSRWGTWWARVVMGPAINLPSNFSVGTAVIGTRSSKTVSVSSVGTQPLTFASFGISGNFSGTQACKPPLDPGSTCTLTISFAPSSIGNSIGTLTVFDNAPGSPHTIALSGTGFDLTLSPSRPPRGTRNAANLVKVGQAAAIPVSLVTAGGFTGTISFTCPGAPVGVSCKVSPATVAVVADQLASPAEVQVLISALATARASRLHSRRRAFPDRRVTIKLNASFAGATRTLELPIVIAGAN